MANRRHGVPDRKSENDMITCELHEPADLQEAAQYLRQYLDDSRLLAGGTDLLVDLKTARVEARHVISLHRITNLRTIENRGDLRIGALTTVAQLENSPRLTGAFTVLREAARQMASPQIRNSATVGGNIASAVPCADLPPVLGVLNASLTLWSPKGERQIPLTEFFSGPRATARREEEILTTIVVPQPPPRFGAAYARFSLRDGNSIAVASVAASLALDGHGAISACRLMLGAVAPIPKRAVQAEQSLAGLTLVHGINDAIALATQAAEPITDLRASADYRRALVGILTRRALTTAHQRAREATND